MNGLVSWCFEPPQEITPGLNGAECSCDQCSALLGFDGLYKRFPRAVICEIFAHRTLYVRRHFSHQAVEVSRSDHFINSRRYLSIKKECDKKKKKP